MAPDYARSWYYIRAPERDQLEPIKQRVMKIAEGAALDLFTNPERVLMARSELIARLRGRTYLQDPSVEAPLAKAREMAKSLQGK